MEKIIVAIRHAIPDNSSGSLTKEGEDVQNAMSVRIKNAGIKPSVIYHSPLLRAAQTAQILSKHLGSFTEEDPSLGEYFDSESLLKRITAAKEGSTIFFVGHEPTLAKFMELLTDEKFLPTGLKKSEAVVLSFDGEIGYGKAKLINRFQPE